MQHRAAAFRVTVPTRIRLASTTWVLATAFVGVGFSLLASPLYADSPLGRWNLFTPASTQRIDAKPHPAVARITVDEGGAIASGSGSLVGVSDSHGLVVTNWHVVRDAKGTIQVAFPEGFKSEARVLKTDPDWDLAALLIWKPTTITPLKICETAPQPGDELSIAGYGPGDYRAVTGRCTQYLAPSIKHPYEIVEVSAQARQGDSGGPILNAQGELAGVLFGADRATTSGSYCGRVKWFLSSVWPQMAASPSEPAMPFVAFQNEQPPVAPTTTLAPPPVPEFANAHSNLVPIPSSQPQQETRVIDEPDILSATPPPYSSPSYSLPPLPSLDQTSGFNWEELTGKTRWDKAKSLLAAIGLLAVWRHLSRWMTA